MADFSEEELELIRQHRAKKAASARKVRARVKHDNGAEYEWDLDDDEADRLTSKYRLHDEGDGDANPDDEDDGEGAGAKGRRSHPAGAKAPAADSRKAPTYFRK